MVDGPRLVVDAIRAGLEIQEIFVAPDAIEALGADVDLIDGIDTFVVDGSVLASALDPVNPMPIAAVASWPSFDEADVLADERPILVAVELRDPGNLGTIIRTAEAAGLAGVIVTGASVDRFSPKVVRASAGSLFRLPVLATDDPVATVTELGDRGRPVVAAVVTAEAPTYDLEDLSSAAILLGNEPHGLPADVVAAAERPVTIPMAPGVESLNVAAAASVLCFEAARQRRQGGDQARNPVDSHRSDAHRVHNDCTEDPNHVT